MDRLEKYNGNTNHFLYEERLKQFNEVKERSHNCDNGFAKEFASHNKIKDHLIAELNKVKGLQKEAVENNDRAFQARRYAQQLDLENLQKRVKS